MHHIDFVYHIIITIPRVPVSCSTQIVKTFHFNPLIHWTTIVFVSFFSSLKPELFYVF